MLLLNFISHRPEWLGIIAFPFIATACYFYNRWRKQYSPKRDYDPIDETYK